MESTNKLMTPKQLRMLPAARNNDVNCRSRKTKGGTFLLISMRSAWTLNRPRIRFHYSVFKCLRFHIAPFSDDLEAFPLLRFRQERKNSAWYKNGGVSITPFSFVFISFVRTRFETEDVV